MKAGWEVKSLGDFAQIRYGYTAKANIENVGPHFLRITDIQNGSVDWGRVPYCQITDKDRKKFSLTKGDIVFARTGATTGKSFQISEETDAVFASYLIRVRATQQNLSDRFLSLFFQTSEYWEAVELGTEGAAQGGFNASKLAELKIPLPPLEEQKRIVAVLDAAFEGLTRARAHVETNLQNARELFQAQVSTEFSKLQDTFGRKRIGDIADHRLGKMLDKNKNQGEPRKYLRNTNVQWFEIGTSDLLEMRIEDKEVEKYSVQKGDLLICEGGYPGRAAIWTEEEPIFFQKALHRVRFEEPIYNRLLLYWLYFADQTGGLTAHCSGAGILHFTGQSLAKFEMPFPSKEAAINAVEAIEETKLQSETLQTHYRAKLQDLDDLRQSLLQKAFAGELT